MEIKAVKTEYCKVEVKLSDIFNGLKKELFRYDRPEKFSLSEDGTKIVVRYYYHGSTYDEVIISEDSKVVETYKLIEELSKKMKEFKSDEEG